MEKYVNNRNPLLPLNVYIPNGEPHVMPDGTLYVYGSYDREADTYCSGEYHVVFTKDLENWAHSTPAMRVLIREMMRHTTSWSLI